MNRTLLSLFFGTLILPRPVCVIMEHKSFYFPDWELVNRHFILIDKSWRMQNLIIRHK